MMIDPRAEAQRLRINRAEKAILDAMHSLSGTPDEPSEREWIMALQNRQTRLIQWQLETEWKHTKKG